MRKMFCQMIREALWGIAIAFVFAVPIWIFSHFDGLQHLGLSVSTIITVLSIEVIQKWKYSKEQEEFRTVSGFVYRMLVPIVICAIFHQELLGVVIGSAWLVYHLIDWLDNKFSDKS